MRKPEAMNEKSPDNQPSVSTRMIENLFPEEGMKIPRKIQYSFKLVMPGCRALAESLSRNRISLWNDELREAPMSA